MIGNSPLRIFFFIISNPWVEMG